MHCDVAKMPLVNPILLLCEPEDGNLLVHATLVRRQSKVFQDLPAEYDAWPDPTATSRLKQCARDAKSQGRRMERSNRIIVIALALGLLLRTTASYRWCWRTHTNEVNLNEDVPVPETQPLAYQLGADRVWCRPHKRSSRTHRECNKPSSIEVLWPKMRRALSEIRDSISWTIQSAALADVWK